MFFLSQDQSNLILKNTVTIFTEKNSEKPAYQNLFEVISSPFTEDTKSIGVASFEGMAVNVFTESLVAMRAELAEKHESDSKEVSLHFYSGGKKVYKRGRIISKDCERMTFRTWVKSVPTLDLEATEFCLES
ncbi:hypothetical protein ACL7TT_06125 [Microbulbifer sp. 2304DJ12-6]|uniref:hypothetical protein n=1 Tax=Microbulbifer sp. 2304DJ12-6 TaxID=3233340 RepID=UPI0039B04763